MSERYFLNKIVARVAKNDVLPRLNYARSLNGVGEHKAAMREYVLGLHLSENDPSVKSEMDIISNNTK